MEININQEEFLMETTQIALEKHNMKNAMAATSVAQLMRIRKQTIRKFVKFSRCRTPFRKSAKNSKCAIYQ